MSGFSSFLPIAAIIVSLIAFVLIILFDKKPNAREAVTIIAAISKFGIVFSMVGYVLDGRYPQMRLFSLSPGIDLALRVDEAGIIFALLASLLWIVTSFYSIGYMRGLSETRQTRFFASFALCLSSTIGLAFSANLLTFYLFYEILTIATYPLVTHKGTPESIKAGRKYLAYLLTGGVILLVAIVYTYQISGTLDFKPGGILPAGASFAELAVLFSLFLVGFGFKAAIIPLHSWLPSAMVAPTPVSALLHAVAVVKAGVFGLVRATGFVIGPEVLADIGAGGVMAILASVTIVIASLLAFRQDNLKLRLAYSTVAHLSYIVLGLALFSDYAWNGALLHIVNHGVMKITLFFCAGAIYVKTHLTNISDLDGIGRKMPLTMSAFTIATMGLAGMPPVAGFVSKFLLVEGAFADGRAVFGVVLLISGLLNAGYFFPIVYRAFFKSPSDNTGKNEAPALMLIPIMVTAGLSLLFGLFPDGIFHFFNLAQNAVSQLAGGIW
ncbi:MAG: monovalent cation/H+ antiporter subunit D family protein [Dehalococcoidales bacterium]|jgi:multicomponent Na+:H+ antiporter subunit D|nr:monovalent cation/H+ antiporter subunit D family protein [Dehalococcoidales bacterium]MDD3264581.1 monovalent cation/H+ antiporter subunit D family protein [Dehalococcoidales bacterium]MDD4322223.1 monovalent cation/H+ antiporter subunit D family protein [Dehalococcoidales bacterium]MDD4793803.1 monovalent cation/H+ antiporter subunit D family protein [Dehalococcoidales bacterium]MDD5122271.1 monovalent cation/H+ antiporter subunit D family protein [Dehalococcoidales bacterium]